MELTDAMIDAAARLVGLAFTEAELRRDALQQQLDAYAQLRAAAIPNALVPALQFLPHAGQPAREIAAPAKPMSPAPVPQPPADPEALAFRSISELGRHLRAGQITSVDLTEMYLRRLKRFDPILQCVVTLTEERALEQARRADAELAAGRDRGPLHGLPWGAKDLLATRGIRTTWGATPFTDQLVDADAT